MPLIALKCSCGTLYESLQGMTAQKDCCPSCGATEGERVPPSSLTKGRESNIALLDPKELAEVREAQAYYSSPEVAEKILSGKIKINENGPKELRPVCPESMRKRYY